MPSSAKSRKPEGNGQEEQVSLPQGGITYIDVSFEGLPPGLMFQSKGLMELEGKGNKSGVQLPPNQEAYHRAHWTKIGGKEQLCIPWVMLYRCICKAGARFKWRGRTSFEYILASTISCKQEVISLGTDQFETFVDWVRIPPKTGAMVKIGRPLLRDWSCSFTFTADAETYKATYLREILVEAGKNVGIGANRPQLKGPNGRFRVTRFEIKG